MSAQPDKSWPAKLVRELVNLVWYSTALVIVLAALVVTSGRELLPRINLQNAALARYLSERTGTDIRFEKLHGQWIQLMPELTAQSVSLRSTELDIRLNEVRMHIDLANSLLSLSPVFERLEIDSANIQYRGQTTAQPQTMNLDETWRIIYALLRRNIHIRNVDVDLRLKEKPRHFHLQDFRVEQTHDDQKKIFLRLLGQDGQEDLYATGTLSGYRFSNSTGNFYLNVGDWPLQEWLPGDGENLPPAAQAWRNAPWHIRGQVWLSWSGASSLEGVADLNLASTSNDSALPASLHTLVSGKWSTGHRQAVLHTLSLQQQDRSVTVLDNLLVSSQGQAWRLQDSDVDLSQLQGIIPYLPPGRLQELFSSLSPTGHLRNLDLWWDNTQPLTERMQLKANADHLATGPWHGVPAFTGVSGYLESGIGYGFIDVASTDGFSMHYPMIYHSPLTFDRAAGRVQWQWLPEDKTILVGSDHARLDSIDGEANGNFLLRLPANSTAFVPEMHLAIGLRNSEARFRDKYLPFILPNGLLSWLSTSIGNARVPDAGFIYRGALSGNEPFSRAVQFYANFQQGDLQFDPHWPRVTEAYGKVLVDDGHTQVRAYTGRMYDSTLSNGWVEVVPQSPGLLVNVLAETGGPSKDGLRILRETPLHDLFGTSLDSWEIQTGEAKTQLGLQIPLQDSPSLPLQDVRVQLSGTNLLMQDIRLPVNGIAGNLAYHSSSGLTSAGLDAELFGSPTRTQIASDKKENTLRIKLNTSGSVSPLALAQWTRLTALQWPEGETAYKAELVLGPFGVPTARTFGQLKVDSNLKGIQLNLPAPFNKPAASAVDFTLSADLFRNNRQEYRFRYGEQARGAVAVQDNAVQNGVIILADGTQSRAAEPVLPNTNGPLRISGQLPSASLEAWAPTINRYAQLPSLSDPAAASFPELDIQVGEVTWLDQTFPATRVQASHEDHAWKIAFAGNRATGTAIFHDSQAGAGQRPELQFDTLRIDSVPPANPTATDNNPAPGQVNDFNFADVPSLKLSVNHFIFNGMDIGGVLLQLDSTPDTLDFSNILAQGPGYKLQGKQHSDENPEGADLRWRRRPDGQFESTFHGMLQMQDEQPVLTHLGIDPVVKGKNIYLIADIAWPGTPLDISINALSGTVKTHGQNGKYLQAKPTAAMTAMNVVDITTWVRRLRLDFSDLKNDGIKFDRYKGLLLFEEGVMSFSEPLEVKSPSSQIEMAGTAYLNREWLDLKLTATLPVGNNATWVAAIAGGLPAAAGVYLVSKIFSDQLQTITSISYSITGDMKDPDIEFQRIAPPKLKPENSEKALPRSGTQPSS